MTSADGAVSLSRLAMNDYLFIQLVDDFEWFCRYQSPYVHIDAVDIDNSTTLIKRMHFIEYSMEYSLLRRH